MESNLNSQLPSKSLIINKEGMDFLSEIGKWSYFLSIVGFIGLGFFVIFALFAGTIISLLGASNGDLGGMSAGILSAVYLTIAAVQFFPLYYLFNFGKKIRDAFEDNNQKVLNEALGNLKSHYKFIGILVLIFLGIYGLGILGTLLSALFM